MRLVLEDDHGKEVASRVIRDYPDDPRAVEMALGVKAVEIYRDYVWRKAILIACRQSSLPGSSKKGHRIRERGG